LWSRLLLSSSFGGRFIVIQERVVVFAFRDVFRSVALFAQFVVDKPEFASLFTGRNSVQTDEEFGTVFRVRVLGMRVELPEFINGASLGALESTLCFKGIRFSLAARSVSGFGPVTYSRIFIEPESRRTSVLLSNSINASVEDVTDSGVRVRVESVKTGTQVAGALWGLEIQSVSTINVEVVITWLLFAGEGVKN